MADISKVKTPDGNTYNVKDSTARDHIANKNNPHGVTKAQIGLGNVNNTSDAEKPYYKLIGRTETNTNKVGHFDFNDASKSLYKIKNFYAASGEGDYFYLAHKKLDYTITTTKHFSNVYALFTANLADDCAVATNLISESDPAILTIVRNGTITATDVLTLIFYEHRGEQTKARLKHWKLEVMAAYANSPNYTKHTWKDGDWLTVSERTNVSDSINRLWCGLNPYYDDGLSFLYIKGIRITIYAATPYSTKSGDFGCNRLEIAGIRLLDSRPSFSPAEALGALDVAGGTVYGKTTFQEGISATSYSGATATSSTDGLMSKSDKSKLDGIGAGSNVKSVNSKTGAVTLTKSDIGLSNVDNTADSAKSVKYATSAGSANSVAWGNVSGKPSTYPPSSHTHTPAQVGLGNVANLDQSKAIKSITRNGTTFTATALDGTTTTFTQQDTNTTYPIATSSTDGLMSKSDKSKLDGIATGAEKNTVTGVKGSSESSYRTGNVNITKANIGLSNVDNTADSQKAVKSAVSATKDSQGQQINATYIKELSALGRTITAVKGNGASSIFNIAGDDLYLFYRGVATGDLNKLTTTGIYYVMSGGLANTGPSNIDITYCYLIVIGFAALKQQFILKPDSGMILMRSYLGQHTVVSQNDNLLDENSQEVLDEAGNVVTATFKTPPEIASNRAAVWSRWYKINGIGV